MSFAAGLVGVRYNAADTASKHGLVGLTKSLAMEFANDGVRVNAVCTSGVRTSMVSAPPPENIDWQRCDALARCLATANCAIRRILRTGGIAGQRSAPDHRGRLPSGRRSDRRLIGVLSPTAIPFNTEEVRQ